MAGSETHLAKTLDSSELGSLSPAIKYKLEVALGSKTTELDDIKGKYEKLRVTSGISHNVFKTMKHPGVRRSHFFFSYFQCYGQ
jgi:hypothetical protein